MSSDEYPPKKEPDYHCNGRKIKGGGFVGYCEARAGKGTDHVGEGRCKHHAGSTPTKDENPDVGAPEGSANALEHGATADPFNLYNNLDDERREWVEVRVTTYLEESGISETSPIAERVELAVIMMAMERGARSELIKEDMKRTSVVGIGEYGSPIEDEEAHYLNRVASSLNTDIRMTLKDAGLLDDPESQKADALQDGLDLTLSAEEKEELDSTFDVEPQT